MSEIEKLQKLGLVSKVCAELDNHLGFSDKTLAEFIIHIAEQHDNPKSFQSALAENGAEFPDKFSENLLRIIHKISKPTATIDAPIIPTVPLTESHMKFPGLARPNTAPVPLVDMGQEEVVTVAYDKNGNVRELKKLDPHSESATNYSEKKDISRGRDRSHSRGKYGRARGRSDSRDRRRDRDGDRNRDRDGRRRSRSKSPPRKKVTPAEPELYGIYDGKISNILDFGCFVELDNFVRKEGLVHIAQIQQGLVRDPRQAVKRGQRVKVKIISMAGSKIALSMKEVDQNTGADLLPQR